MSTLFFRQRTVIVTFLQKLESFLSSKLEANDKDIVTLKTNIARMKTTVAQIIQTLPNDEVDTSMFDESKLKEPKMAEKMVVYNHLMYGYMYLIQHTLETVLMSDASVDIDSLKEFYQSLDTYRRSILSKEDCDGVDSQTLGLLLKYINYFSNNVNSGLQKYIDKTQQQNQALTPEEIKELNKILEELTDKPSDKQIEDYKTFYAKLDNIRSIITNLKSSEDRFEKVNWNEVDEFKKENQKNIIDIIGKITESSTLLEMGESVNFVKSIIDEMGREGNMKKASTDLTISEVSKVNKDLTDKVDELYFSLVDLYETVSGAVRVYIRTKDYVKGDAEITADIDGKGMDKYGILKNTETKMITLKDGADELRFGPFYNVIPSGTTNKGLIDKDYINMKNFIAKFDKSSMTKQTSLVFFTYGYSGAGKSYTLFNKHEDASGNLGENSGLLYTIKNIFKTHNYNLEFEDYRKIYGYLEGDEFKSSIYSDPSMLDAYKTNIETFIDEEVEVSILQTYNKSNPETFVEGLKTDAFIKSTPNNPQSSRGFLVLWFNVIREKEGSLETVGKLGFVDMAGNEDPYDLLVKLSPTLKWPSVGENSFMELEELRDDKNQLMKDKNNKIINKPLDYGEIDLVCGLLQKQIFKYVSYSVEFMALIYRLIKANASQDVLNKNMIRLMTQMYVSWEEAGAEYKLNLYTKENSILLEALNSMNQKNMKHVLGGFLQFYDNNLATPNNKLKTLKDSFPSGDVKIVVPHELLQMQKRDQKKNIQRNYSKYKDLNLQKIKDSIWGKVEPKDCFFNISSIKQSGGTTYVSSTIKEFESDHTQNLIKFAIKNEMQNIEKTFYEEQTDDKNNKYDPDLLSFNPTKIVQFTLNSPSGGYVSFEIKSLLVNVVQNANTDFWFDKNGKMKVSPEGNTEIINSDPDTAVIKDTVGFKNAIDNCEKLLYKLINEPKYDDKKSVDDNKIRMTQTINILKYTSLFKYCLGLATTNKNVVKDLQYKLPISYSVSWGRTFNMSVTEDHINLAVDNIVNGSTREYLPDDPAGYSDFKKVLLNVKSLCADTLKTYFSTTTRNITINNEVYPFPQDYLLRIIQEGFFINQANAELVQFLKQKKKGKEFAGMPDCTLDKTKFYFENYSKFNDLTVQGKDPNEVQVCKTYTGLVNLLKETFENAKVGASAKYIMLCNVRREEDIKFRTGAIDTLKLVQSLKST